MLPEIIFRGQTRKYGEKVRMGDGMKVPGHWVYGGIFSGTGDRSIIYGAEQPRFTGAELDKHVVYSDTLGIWIGCEDMHDQMIFTDDIVKVIGHPGDLAIVTVDRAHPRIMLKWVKANRNDPTSDFATVIYTRETEQTFEVVGNIHDNPELLENL